MNRNDLKIIRRKRRKMGTRKGLLGTPGKPRLSIFRSNKHIYGQIIDDLSGRTLAAASTNDKGDRPDNGANCGAATTVGKKLAEKAGAAGITEVVFDRNGFRYHGRVKALADAAREGGLKF